MLNKQKSGHEHRKAKRYRYPGQVLVGAPGTGDSQPANVLDLSASGCLLRMIKASDFRIGATLEVTINSAQIAFRALGAVRHFGQDRFVVGISFVNLGRRGASDLQELIADLESDAAQAAQQSPR
jgi:hypothetical protein